MGAATVVGCAGIENCGVDSGAAGDDEVGGAVRGVVVAGTDGGEVRPEGLDLVAGIESWPGAGSDTDPSPGVEVGATGRGDVAGGNATGEAVTGDEGPGSTGHRWPFVESPATAIVVDARPITGRVVGTVMGRVVGRDLGIAAVGNASADDNAVMPAARRTSARTLWGRARSVTAAIASVIGVLRWRAMVRAMTAMDVRPTIHAASPSPTRRRHEMNRSAGASCRTSKPLPDHHSNAALDNDAMVTPARPADAWMRDSSCGARSP